MAEKKIFVVFGATGVQGGSVINSVLGDPKAAQEFKIRGITRDPSKPNAQALTKRGVECVTVSRAPSHTQYTTFCPEAHTQLLLGRHQR